VGAEAPDFADAHPGEVWKASHRVHDGVDLEGLDERDDDLELG
jgi:hypothetical protein